MSGTSDGRNIFHVKENGFVVDFFLAPPQPGHLSAGRAESNGSTTNLHFGMHT